MSPSPWNKAALGSRAAAALALLLVASSVQAQGQAAPKPDETKPSPAQPGESNPSETKPAKPAPAAVTSGSFDAKGVRIFYTVQGKGEPVVLLHGWLASGPLNWTIPGATALLAKDYQVVLMDFRGHGQSDKPAKPEAYGPELVEDVLRLMDHLKIKKAHIVGYSMGGIVAGAFLSKHPERVVSCAICGMGWVKEGGPGQWGFAQIGKDDPKAKPWVLCGQSLAKLALTEAQIKAIRAPVAVLVGAKDDLILKLYVDPLRPVRKDWPIVEIPDGNHLSCVGLPRFHQEILAWLRKHSAK